MGGTFMSSKNQEVYQFCQDTINGKLTIKELSILIQKSYRQSQRLVEKVRNKGMLGVKHGNFGKIPYNKTSLIVETDIKNLLRKDYYDFNLTHFREMILEKEGLKAGRNVIHRIAKLNGLVKNPKRSGLRPLNCRNYPLINAMT
jgi:hypothetical protein